MKLLVISYKPCFLAAAHSRQYVASGGFPLQMETLAELFDETRLVIVERREARPSGAVEIRGRGVAVDPLPEPRGSGWSRKFRLIPWSIRHVGRLWREVASAEAVHCLVPGDIGFLGLIFCLLQQKRVFVRHCGTWGVRDTLANRFLHRVLVKAAGGRVVVMATGGGDEPPEPSNRAVTWIFSTSLSESELEGLTDQPTARQGSTRLVTVGRLSRGKNTRACIAAMPQILETIPDCTLEVIGEGPEEERLRKLATSLGVAQAVRFRGGLPHEEVLCHLQRSHLFLFPTQVAEGFPKAVLEAMACGLPVIAPSVSVLPSLLGDERGVVLDHTKAEDVAAAVLDLAQDRQRLAEMGGKARAAARQYSLERWRDLIRERLETAWEISLNRDESSGIEPSSVEVR